MICSKDIAVVIPVFNPEPGLKALCDNFSRAYSTVVVVDDGSVENTEDFSCLPEAVDIVRHAENRGKGRAIKTAIAWLKENRPYVKAAVFVDGDGQHRCEDVAKVVEKACETNNAVLGVRDFLKAGVPFRSRLGNIVTAFLVRLMFKIPIYDTQTGLRAIPRRLFDMMLETDGERFEYEMRLFGKLSTRSERLEQVPIETIYIASNRTSHFRPIRDTIRIYRGLFGGRFLKFVVSSVASFVVDNGVFALAIFSLQAMGISRNSGILAAVVFSRAVSGVFNYACNRRLVFSASGSKRASLGRYAVLALLIMLLSYAGTSFFSLLFNVDGVLITIVKIAVDITLFLLSYRLQKRWVFPNVDE